MSAFTAAFTQAVYSLFEEGSSKDQSLSYVEKEYTKVQKRKNSIDAATQVFSFELLLYVGHFHRSPNVRFLASSKAEKAFAEDPFVGQISYSYLRMRRTVCGTVLF